MDIDAIAPVGLDRTTILALSRRSDRHGLRQLGIHFALLGLTGCLIWASRGSPWLAAAIVLHGIVLDALFCALHESVHRTAFATRWLNDAVAGLCGVLLLLPCDYFRLFHFAHHRFTQDPAKDPELSGKKPSSIGVYLWLASGLPNWWSRLTVTLRHALTGQAPEPFIPPSKRPAVVREARLVWAIYAAVALISLTLWRAEALVYWVLPAIAGQPFLRLFLLAEHTGCAFGNDMYANTRTTYTNAAVRLMTWRMSYHVEHHAFPSVPFHALARVNMLIQDRIAVIGRGYLAVHWAFIRDMAAERSASSARSRALRARHLDQAGGNPHIRAMPKIEIYTQPFCGYCYRAKKLLDDKGVAYEEIDVMEQPARRSEMIERAGGRSSTPQIFIDGQGIGGSDDMAAMNRKGELDVLLGLSSAS